MALMRKSVISIRSSLSTSSPPSSFLSFSSGLDLRPSRLPFADSAMPCDQLPSGSIVTCSMKGETESRIFLTYLLTSAEAEGKKKKTKSLTDPLPEIHMILFYCTWDMSMLEPVLVAQGNSRRQSTDCVSTLKICKVFLSEV